jgi:uncharacterized protein YidB (DUF937 family)
VEKQMGLLDSVLGGGYGPRQSSGMSPLTMGLLGLLAYRTFQGKGRLAEMLGQSAPGTPREETGGTSQPSIGRGGLFGGLLGGNAGGGILSGGLSDLLSQFQQNGHGDKAQSWISTGTNKPVAPNELEQVLGPEKIDWLVKETGMPREELLAGLSRELPAAVDKLTPAGRIPTGTEIQQML